MKCLRVTKIVKEIKFEGAWDELEAKNISRDNQSQNIWDWLWFSCEIKHYGKSLISVFEVLTEYRFWQEDGILGYQVKIKVIQM